MKLAYQWHCREVGDGWINGLKGLFILSVVDREQPDWGFFDREIVLDAFAYTAAYSPQTIHRPLPILPSHRNPASILAHKSYN